jgi:parallel beta-helix repeat protein
MNRSVFPVVSAALVLPVALLCSLHLAAAASLKVPGQYGSIQAALAAAKPGDTVKVAQGTYFVQVALKKGVRLEGGWKKDFSRRDPASFVTTLDGARKKGPVVKCADNAVLDGFTIIHGSLLKTENISDGSGINCDGVSSMTIAHNVIRDNEPSGVFFEKSSGTVSANRIADNAQAGIYMQKGSSLKISGNDIWGNGYSGIGSGKKPDSKFVAVKNRIHENDRSGINAQTASGTVRNNLIYANKRSGIRCLPMPMKIINNTVVGSGWAGILVEDPSAVATIKNNIIAHNVDGGIRTNGKGYDHNLLFANGETGDCDPRFLWCVKPQFGGYGDETSYLKTRNIIADPMFVDPEKHDYHLKPGSPAIDGGDRKKEFNDVNFPPSLGGPVNDMGFYGGPLTTTEKRSGNRKPTARIKADEQTFTGRRAILDASDSTDPDGDALGYSWKLTAKPDGSKARLNRPDKVKSAFKADKPGTYTVQLTVTDRLGAAGKPVSRDIVVPANRAPKAAISEVLSKVSTGDTITLYGSASKDPEKQPLTYKWSLVYKPRNSQATLSGADGEESSLSIDVDGSYSVQLVVNDGSQDSEPVSINISTKNPVSAGIRRVPGEYPTIQSALDAAQPGDDIIVEAGTYKEMLVIDKSVNLIGKNWPVIDGGRLKGNKNTISVFYLGDRAGRIEGFVITGGGTGELAHGINIWDSAPEIVNNRITGNNHGMGIHGSPSLTSKTKVHGNLVYNNLVGIGNGKDSVAHIYNNRVYNNSIVGIGSRGKAKPLIEKNFIYNNRLGIGAREVASPRIEKNYIHDNTDGIVISPLSTIKKFAFDDIVIHNNLIVNNAHLGISITSFNLSKVIITNNTIDSNNLKKRKIRGGGLVFGYPHPATFTAEVKHNIITNNMVGGIVNYTGPDNFKESGVKQINEANNVWNNTANYLDCLPGANALCLDPRFTGPKNPDKAISGYRPSAGKTDSMGHSFDATDFAELPAEVK